eukprot:237798_1
MAVNESLFTEYSVDEKCTSIKQCKSFKRICHILSFYQSISDDNNNDMNQIENFIINYIETNKYQHIISDFHHILIEHLNHATLDDNCLNYDLINKLCSKYVTCNIINCQFYIRNGRDREIESHTNNKKRDKNAQVIMEVLDNIHTYFMHGYDTGFRVHYDLLKFDNKSNNDDENDEKAPIIYTDNVMSNLSNQLKIKRDALIKQRGLSRVENNKFVTKVDTDVQKIDEKIDIKTEEILDIEYSFGTNYYYWKRYKDNQEIDTIGNLGYVYGDWYVKAKYKNIKDETLNNIICNISNRIWKNILIKATKYYDTPYCQAIKCIKYRFDEYKLPPNEVISINHLISILLYTDFTQLSYSFTLSFREQCKNENLLNIKQRHSNYYWWAKLLREAVECYGNEINTSTVKCFWHGISAPMVFKSTIATFNCPTSTTTEMEVASNFSTKGIILQLTGFYKTGSGGYYFNCNWLSSYSNEQERLFIGGYWPLQFENIINRLNGNDYSLYLHAFNILIAAMNGLPLSSDYHIVTKMDKYIIKHLVNNTDKCKQFDPYFMNIYNSFRNNKYFVHFDLFYLANDSNPQKSRYMGVQSAFSGYSFFKNMLLTKPTNPIESFIKLDVVCKLFPNIHKMYIYYRGAYNEKIIITDKYLDTIYNFLLNDKINGIKIKNIHIEKEN